MRPLRTYIPAILFFTFILSSLGVCGGIKPGQEIKIFTTGDEWFQGTVYSMDSTSFTLSSRWGHKQIYRTEIVEMWQGKPATVRGAFLGLCAGVGLGFAYYGIDRGRSDAMFGYSHEDRPMSDYKWVIVGFGAGGLAIGSMVGTALTEWFPVDKAEFAVDAGTMGRDGLHMQVSFRF
jgi:hypothetical protein